MKISAADTREMAYKKGVFAAHEPRTPDCPYNEHYEARNYKAWYDGFSTERKFMNKEKEYTPHLR
jgi:hypothetical protein